MTVDHIPGGFVVVHNGQVLTAPSDLWCAVAAYDVACRRYRLPRASEIPCADGSTIERETPEAFTERRANMAVYDSEGNMRTPDQIRWHRAHPPPSVATFL
jgi:hypothetical protein